MTDRDKIKELLKQAQDKYCDICAECAEDGYKDHESFEDFFADYLLANGVIVPPCKVGDKVWIIHEKRIFEIMCIGFYQDPDGFYVAVANDEYSTVRWKVKYSETLFLTKEEAEAELRKRGVSNAENN